MSIPPTINSAPPIAPARPVRTLRILYAEDLPELRELMREVLEQEGHRVETAPDGGAALERLKQDYGGFDLLITDHHMPGINGLELVRRTRQLPFPGKIIVFSSELSDEANAQYRRHAVDAILPKPIFPLTFRAVMDELFTRSAPPAKPDSGSAPPV